MLASSKGSASASPSTQRSISSAPRAAALPWPSRSIAGLMSHTVTTPCGRGQGGVWVGGVVRSVHSAGVWGGRPTEPQSFEAGGSAAADLGAPVSGWPPLTGSRVQHTCATPVGACGGSRGGRGAPFGRAAAAAPPGPLLAVWHPVPGTPRRRCRLPRPSAAFPQTAASSPPTCGRGRVGLVGGVTSGEA